ncbi:MAG: NAD(P)H-dependent glycerol-3-phosphate dehydrogenase [Clostridiales bacterium]|uniref:NAD(P)H-dependent glycerol-3-phosphate dehydrogenase n=1 Tax=Clostridium sp. N3C TaxID=1776758 RepID=UPI00092E13C4|nr:NAD(P)H-dependent glycerol-3-phosphate dehydrogenase [Clostridium sp. N3C]NLZ49126.1 NAD(P)H-dependent glycerol-3-phosphate dehydrogenase [Clostridiales bacterium]SCN22081.1 Glycerol-3-phosphate dehydrogenase [NAD(P)+] [Clostridium sp. N3C]
MSKVGFIGAGSFGTALSIHLAKKGYEVYLWDREERVVEEINNKRTNEKYLKNIIIPHNVKASTDMATVIDGADFVVIAVPSHVVRLISKKISEYIKPAQIIVSIAKGIEEDSLKRLSQVISEENPNNDVVVFSGPSHAEEVSIAIPTTVVVTSTNMKAAEKVQDLFMSSALRVYTNSDIIGVEIGGAVKNIIALAAGICDGIGYGDNAKAALMTRGMHEIVRIGTKLGGKRDTFYGLTGMGDLIVTCTSIHSRNRRAGILIGKGYTMKEAVQEVGMVVEGISACKAFYMLKERENVEMPITDVLYKILFEDLNPKDAVFELMTRDKKDEKFL